MTKKQFIKALKEINIMADPEENYSRIYNLVWDFMDNSNCHLLEDVFDAYVNADHAGFLVEQNAHDFETVWFLMRGITEMADLYYMEGWCLRNVTIHDISYLIDELFDRLEEIPEEENE